jgi:L-xylulokinase
VTDAAEAGARGAAVLAGIGVGVFADLDDAAARTVRVVRRQDPRPGAAATLDRRYRHYRDVVAALVTAG